MSDESFVLGNITSLRDFDVEIVLERVFRTSGLQMSFKVGILTNFITFTMKYL